ncbi:carbonyl reductase [NADPH] 1-like [Apostichopus japonicus]|uniref:carbonyl reductase [NADPH] 1-like n=1 Tax=Stichopus japonicus TaxID=307972 RepID=UPI003AB3A70A
MAKVALVSGANKGIGFACVRALCKQLKDDNAVYLTARNPELGKKAVADLEKEGLKPRFHQLDITDQRSVEALRDHVKKEHGGLDIVINNAGFAFRLDDKASAAEQAAVSCQVNYFGTARVFDVLSPILRPHSEYASYSKKFYCRVVNVSSMTAKGVLKRLDPELKKEFQNTSTRNEVDMLVKRYIELMASGEAEKYGFTTVSNCGFSKLGLCALTRVQNSDMQKDLNRPGINVYSVCPGYVATDMSSYKGPKTPDEGADTLIWLALQPQGTTMGSGEFFADRKVISLL